MRKVAVAVVFCLVWLFFLIRAPQAVFASCVSNQYLFYSGPCDPGTTSCQSGGSAPGNYSAGQDKTINGNCWTTNCWACSSLSEARSCACGGGGGEYPPNCTINAPASVNGGDYIYFTVDVGDGGEVFPGTCQAPGVNCVYIPGPTTSGACGPGVGYCGQTNLCSGAQCVNVCGTMHTQSSYSGGTCTISMSFYNQKGTGPYGSTWPGPTCSTTVQVLACVPTAPGKVHTPSPVNGATGVSQTPTLTWLRPGSWGNGCPTTPTYNIYFGTSSSPPRVKTRQARTNTSYNPGSLLPGTTYYWRVDTDNGPLVTTGDLWSFTTLTTCPPTVNASGSIAGAPQAVQVCSGASGTGICSAASASSYSLSVPSNATSLLYPWPDNPLGYVASPDPGSVTTACINVTGPTFNYTTTSSCPETTSISGNINSAPSPATAQTNTGLVSNSVTGTGAYTINSVPTNASYSISASPLPPYQTNLSGPVNPISVGCTPATGPDFTYVCPAPAAPTNLSPTGTTLPGPGNFSWTAASGATSYQIQIDDLTTSPGWNGCGSPLPGDSCATTGNLFYPYTFLSGHTYHWQVVAIMNCGGGNTAQTASGFVSVIVSSSPPFFTTFGGDVIARGNLNDSTLPTSPAQYLAGNDRTSGSYAGPVFGNPVTVPSGQGSQRGWQLSPYVNQSSLVKLAYPKLLSNTLTNAGLLQSQLDGDPACNGGGAYSGNNANPQANVYCYGFGNLDSILGTAVSDTSGKVVIVYPTSSASNTQTLVTARAIHAANRRVVVFVNGNLTVSGSGAMISLPQTNWHSGIVFVLNNPVPGTYNGDINVAANVTELDGVYIFPGNFNDNTLNNGNDATLNGNGMLLGTGSSPFSVAGASTLQRLPNSTSVAGEIWTYEPKYLDLFRTVLAIPSYQFRELPPS